MMTEQIWIIQWYNKVSTLHTMKDMVLLLVPYHLQGNIQYILKLLERNPINVETLELKFIEHKFCAGLENKNYSQVIDYRLKSFIKVTIGRDSNWL